MLHFLAHKALLQILTLVLAAPGREVLSCPLHRGKNRVSARWHSQRPAGERQRLSGKTGATSRRASGDLKARAFALIPVGALTGLDRRGLQSGVHSEKTPGWSGKSQSGMREATWEAAVEVPTRDGRRVTWQQVGSQRAAVQWAGCASRQGAGRTQAAPSF